MSKYIDNKIITKIDNKQLQYNEYMNIYNKITKELSKYNI